MVRRVDTRNTKSTPREYGEYQWCVKYYGWRNEEEKRDASLYFLGEYDHVLSQHQKVNKVVGRPVSSYRAGQNEGWLVVDTELTLEELDRLDQYVEMCCQRLESWLEEQRRERSA